MTDSNDAGASGLTAATWWTVDHSHEPPLTRGATPLVERCIRKYGWTEAFALRVLHGYRQFLALKHEVADWNGNMMCPSTLIGRMWHEHIMGGDQRHYEQDCQVLFGRLIHNRYLDNGGNRRLHGEELRRRLSSTTYVLRLRLGETYDREVWKFETDMEREQATTTLVVPETRKRKRCDESSNPNDKGRVEFVIHNELDGADIFLKINKTTPMGEAFKIFARIQGTRREWLVFHWNGQAVKDDDTAESLGLQDHDEIKANAGKISFRIRDEERGEVTFFKIRRTCPLGRAFEIFAKRAGLKRDCFVFRRGDKVINDDDTVETLGLCDNEAIQVESNIISISVRDDDGLETFFKLKRNTRIGILFDSYAQFHGLNRINLCFLSHNGEMFDEQCTPEMLQLEDQDTIFVKDIERDRLHPLDVVFSVCDRNGERIRFRCRRRCPLGTLFEVFAKRQAVERRALVFHTDRAIAMDDDTPETLGLQMCDTVYASFVISAAA